MLKQIVVDKVMARQLWKLGFKEPTLSYYDVNGQFFDGRSGKAERQNAEGDTLELKDYNAPKETRGLGARCLRNLSVLHVLALASVSFVAERAACRLTTQPYFHWFSDAKVLYPYAAFLRNENYFSFFFEN